MTAWVARRHVTEDRDRDFALIGLAGVAWQVTWRWRTRLDYVYRYEETETTDLRQHQILVGQEVRF